MAALNYNHLRYFREVAHEGNLTRAAARLNVSQSALSTQIRALEGRLGQPLFDRVGRRLELTEAGRLALAQADRIYAAGDELVAALAARGAAMPPLRVGALSTLSRNFQLRFLAPVLARADVRLELRSGGMAELTEALRALDLDVLLATGLPEGGGLLAHRVAAQPVALHGTPARLRHDGLAATLAAEPVIVPTEPAIRAGFAALAARLGVRPHVVAEVDDMAMVRLLARADVGLAVAPALVLADELASGRLASAPYDLGLEELFYAVTVPRAFPHPLMDRLLQFEDG